MMADRKDSCNNNKVRNKGTLQSKWPDLPKNVGEPRHRVIYAPCWQIEAPDEIRSKIIIAIENVD